MKKSLSAVLPALPALLAVLITVAVMIMAVATGHADEVCAACHEDVTTAMTNQIHMRIQSFEVRGKTVGCEGCHGAATAHIEGDDPEAVTMFSAESPAADACMSCHQSGATSEWPASTHALEGLDCQDCHSIHEAKNPLDSCRNCHQDVLASFRLPSHHPVLEGKLSCSDCHDPHAATEAQLATKMRPNDLCFQCHQAKEGPFIFEHDPVVEDCRLCHSPHGTVADNLLQANEPMLCYQCHEPHFHAAMVSPEGSVEVGGHHYENPNGTQSMNVAMTTKCSQCHSQIHGTDLPSQTLTSGGSGLVR